MFNILAVFGIEHIIYLILMIILMVLGLIFIKKSNLDEYKLNLIFRIIGIIWLITILANRITVTYSDVVINKREGYTWLNLIPNTFCGMCSLILSITFIIGKKDNFVLHSFGYIGLVGGIVTMFYPDFLDSQAFFDPRSITGLLHHTIMAFMIILAILTGYMTPTVKKWHYIPLGMCVIMTIGMFELDCLGFVKAMQFKNPFLSSIPILSSWYVTDLATLVVSFILLTIYDMKKKNCSFKEVFK